MNSDIISNHFSRKSGTDMITMRLMRFGAKKRPSYRIVVMDSERPRQSQALDTIGTYNPMTEPAEIKIDQEKAKYWISKGVQPSQTVGSLLQKVSKSVNAAQDQKS
jgi:small subunit ribosomal protein S16